MANTDAPRGAIPTRQVGGAPHSGGVERFYVGTGDSNNIFIGDFVAPSGTGGDAGLGHRPGAVRATPGSGILGVVVGFENLTSDNLSRTYRPASTEGYLLVATDPDLEFEIQEDSVGGALAAVDIGLNANVIFGAGDTATGTSAMEIDSSTKATTATLDVRLLGFVDRPDNEIGTNAKWRAKINNHALTNTTGA